MTDKQIMIHGVDVNRCMFFNEEYEENDVKIKNFCEWQFVPCQSFDCANCYYKRMMHTGAELNIHKTDKEHAYKRVAELQEQLKAKEQECEQLSNAYEACKDSRLKAYNTIDMLEQECEYWKHQAELGVDTTNRLTKELKETEEECEELKEKVIKWLGKEGLRQSEKEFYEEQLDQLKAELEQEKALKDTYFACYHAKHEDLAKKYDQLKAENEELKRQLTIIDDETIVVEITEKQFEEYQKLQAENEELKNFHINLVGVKECEIRELVKYKQTLAEIKPILEFYANSKIGEEQADGTYKIELAGISMRGYGTDFLIFNPKPAKQALQKISEVIPNE